MGSPNNGRHLGTVGGSQSKQHLREAVGYGENGRERVGGGGAKVPNNGWGRTAHTMCQEESGVFGTFLRQWESYVQLVSLNLR